MSTFQGQPILCCASAAPVNLSNHVRLHNDPNREVHDAIFRSFLAFPVRQQHSVALLALILGSTPTSSTSCSNPSPSASPPPQAPLLTPVLSAEALQNNPLTSDIPYVIHLASRHDFGPVYSHRYFVCPASLQHDWIEITLEQWFAAGEPFKLKAEKWDLKCLGDSKFFRITLRPNLRMRIAPRPDGCMHTREC